MSAHYLPFPHFLPKHPKAKFTIGDVVTLNSDSNEKTMTVEGYTSGSKFKDWWNNLWGSDTNYEYVKCIWHTPLGMRCIGIYHQECLTLVTDASGLVKNK